MQTVYAMKAVGLAVDTGFPFVKYGLHVVLGCRQAFLRRHLARGHVVDQRNSPASAQGFRSGNTNVAHAERYLRILKQPERIILVIRFRIGHVNADRNAVEAPGELQVPVRSRHVLDERPTAVRVGRAIANVPCMRAAPGCRPIGRARARIGHKVIGQVRRIDSQPLAALRVGRPIVGDTAVIEVHVGPNALASELLNVIPTALEIEDLLQPRERLHGLRAIDRNRPAIIAKARAAELSQKNDPLVVAATAPERRIAGDGELAARIHLDVLTTTSSISSQYCGGFSGSSPASR